MRSILAVALGNGPLAVDTRDNTDRKKVLQNATLRAVRAMRAASFRVL